MDLIPAAYRELVVPLGVFALFFGTMFYFAIKGSNKARQKRQATGQWQLEDLKLSDILNHEQRSQESLSNKRKTITLQQKMSFVVLMLISRSMGLVYGIVLFFKPDLSDVLTQQSPKKPSTLTRQEKEKIKEESLIYDKQSVKKKPRDIIADTGSEDDTPPLFS